jgi:hypothetical protein
MRHGLPPARDQGGMKLVDECDNPSVMGIELL